jgi:predicted dehydrogenase
VVFVTARFRTETSVWLQQAARSTLAGGSAIWLGNNYQPDSPYKDSTWRIEHGALWDLGPHVLSLLVPALGPVEGVQATAGLGDTVSLVLTHSGGRVSTVTVSSTVAPLSSGVEVWVHGDAGRLTLLPDYESPVEAHTVAVAELTAAALTGGTHPCDVHAGRDAVAVLATAERALRTGCREPVAA